jgi:hypothetical protein
MNCLGLAKLVCYNWEFVVYEFVNVVNVDFGILKMEKFVPYNPEFVFKCGQPIVDHLFFDHLKSVFFFNSTTTKLIFTIIVRLLDGLLI